MNGVNGVRGQDAPVVVMVEVQEVSSLRLLNREQEHVNHILAVVLVRVYIVQ